ncbi:caspase family protein [Roseobacter sp. A03A-229]
MLVLVLAFHLLAAAAAADERRAILIGVQSYDPSVSRVFPDLQGPENDLLLMRDTLDEIYGGDIEIVSLGGADDPAPTRKAILSQLDDLAASAGPGDEIIIYLSGHGTQLPSSNFDADEPDGLDEVFLASDTELVAVQGGHGLRNHIRDTEIGTRIARMERAGSFVWLIVDSCHAGTMMRGVGADLTPRMADLQASLGGPIIDLNPQGARADGRGGSTDGGKSPSNRLVAFYAAAPDALAFELPIEGEKVHGLFTISLVEAMRAAEGFRFADLARETSARMWARAGPRAQAMYRGALDAPLFGPESLPGRSGSYTLGFDGEALFVEAGRLQGLMPGATLMIEMGTDGQREPLMYGVVSESGLERAKLNIVRNAPSMPNRLPEILTQAGLSPAQFERRWLADRAASLVARLVGDASERSFSVLLDQSMATDLALKVAEAVEQTRGRVQLSETEVDAVLRQTSDRLILRLPPFFSHSALNAAHLGAADMEPEEIAERLVQIAASRSLLKLAGEVAPNQLQTALDLKVARRPAPEATEGVRCNTLPTGLTTNVPEAARQISADATGLPRLLHCDQIFLTLTNTGTAALDVSPLYVSVDGPIYYLSGYAGGASAGLRLAPGASDMVQFTESVVPSQSGRRAALVLLAIPSTAGAAKDFRHLATATPRKPKLVLADQMRSSADVHLGDLRYAALAWPFVSGQADLPGDAQ